MLTLALADGLQIHVHDSDDGWVAGQHVRLRVFFSGRIFESHPLTIVNAPASTSCIPGNTLTLAARSVGDWTRAINKYAQTEQERMRAEKDDQPGVPVQVMIDGPYGGSSIDIGDYESALLVSGGSGATFTLDGTQRSKFVRNEPISLDGQNKYGNLHGIK